MMMRKNLSTIPPPKLKKPEEVIKSLLKKFIKLAAPRMKTKEAKNDSKPKKTLDLGKKFLGKENFYYSFLPVKVSRRKKSLIGS